MPLFGKSQQIGELCIGFASSTPRHAFVQLSEIPDPYGTAYELLWGQYFLYVLRTLEDVPKARIFKNALEQWQEQNLFAPVEGHLRSDAFMTDPWAGLITGPLDRARKEARPLDYLCASKIYQNNDGQSIPYFSKTIFSPGKDPELMLDSIIALAKYIAGRDALFAARLPWLVGGLLGKLRLGKKFFRIKTLRTSQKLYAQCAEYACDASLGVDKVLSGALPQSSSNEKASSKERIVCPYCSKPLLISDGFRGDLQCPSCQATIEISDDSWAKEVAAKVRNRVRNTSRDLDISSPTSSTRWRNSAVWLFWIGTTAAGIFYWDELSQFAVVDFAIIAGFLVSFSLGMYRGSLREMVSLTSWVVAFSLAYVYGPSVSDWLKPLLQNNLLATFFGSASVLVGVVIPLAMLSGRLARALESIGMTDRVFLGGVFGMLRTALVICIVLLITSVTTAVEQDWYLESILIPFLIL